MRSWILGILTVLFLVPGSSILAQGKAYSIKNNRHLIEQGAFQQAITNLEKIIEKKPDHAEAWLWLGIAHYHTGAPQAAVDALDQALLRKLSNEDKVNAYNYSGSAYFRMNYWEESIQQFSKSLFIQPKNLITLVSRGTAAYWSGNYAGALHDFKMALSHHPNNADALLGKGLTLVEMRSYDEAQKVFDQLSTQVSDKGNDMKMQTFYGLARIGYAIGNYDSAIGDLNLAFQYVSQTNTFRHQQLTVLKAFCTLGLGQVDEALALLESAEKQMDPGADLAFEKALVYYLSGDKEQAAAIRGGKGALGIEVFSRDNGIYVFNVYKGSNASAAGMLKNDQIISLNDEVIRDRTHYYQLVRSQEPGENLLLKLKRGHSIQTIEIVVEHYEKYLSESDLAFPLLRKERTRLDDVGIPISELDIEMRDKEPTNVSGAGNIFSDDTASDDKGTFIIDAILIDPSPVLAGEQFDIIIDVFLDDRATDQKDLVLQMDYEIWFNGQVVKQFPPRQLEVTNNDFTTLIRQPKAAKHEGNYSLKVILTYENLKQEKTIDFEIK